MFVEREREREREKCLLSINKRERERIIYFSTTQRILPICFERTTESKHQIYGNDKTKNSTETHFLRTPNLQQQKNNWLFHWICRKNLNKNLPRKVSGKVSKRNKRDRKDRENRNRSDTTKKILGRKPKRGGAKRKAKENITANNRHFCWRKIRQFGRDSKRRFKPEHRRSCKPDSHYLRLLVKSCHTGKLYLLYFWIESNWFF